MKISQKITQNKALISISVLVAFVCFFAVYLRLFTGKELWYEMFAAVLGVIITAVITMILLKGQTNNDVERERDAKVFEEKLRIYQDFLQQLQEVIKDGTLTEEEKILLQFQVSYVAMHCKQECIEKVSASVKQILACKCGNVKVENTDSSNELLDYLFNIIEAFRKDLYGKEQHFEDKIRNNAINNLKLAFETEEIQGDWKNIKAHWENGGWVIEGMNAQNPTLSLKRKDGTGSITIATKPQGLCFQACYPNESDFSQPLKWQMSGYSNNGTWWKYFDKKYRDIPVSQFTEKFNDDKDKEFQQYVISNVSKLKDALDDFQQTMNLKNLIGKHEGCKIFIWYWKILVCNFENIDSVPFLDIFEENGKMLICLGNREKNAKKLDNFIKNTEIKGEKKDHRYLLKSMNPNATKEIAEEINELINKIQKG